MILPTLPVTDRLPALLAALDTHPNAVLVAPPGAGKTTLVPLALLAASWRGDGRIVVLEPRRLAARAAATRMANLLGERPGQTAGYRTRIDSAVSDATRIEVVTEGLMVRRLLSDPTLDGVSAVLLDEIHERSLEGDLALAMLLDLQRVLRPNLRLLAMSATLDGARLSALMDAPVIESAGRMFPVDVQHGRDVADVRDLPDAMARAIRAALAAHAGDILAFLPGMGEIRRTEAALTGTDVTVLPLHGDLPLEQQDRALTEQPGRRVVLATSIAETSLTVPGVRIVIDGGFRRAPRMDGATGLTRLTTLRISRAAADQRAGRAGREGPGVAIRLWSTAQHRGMAPYDRPAILEAELAGLVLDCAAWGTVPDALPFPDPPPAGAVAAAGALLTQLGAMAAGRITSAGRRMADLGAHPRLAAMMLAAGPADRALAATLAALLEERDPLRRDAPADVLHRLEALDGRGDADRGADRGAIARIQQQAARYRSRLGARPIPYDPAQIGPLLAAAFPDRIAQRRGEPGSFRLSGGGGARLSKADPLASERLLVVGALDLKASAQIRLAAPIDPDDLPTALLAQVTETSESGYDPATGHVLSRRRRRLGALILDDRTTPADPAEAASALAAAAGRRLETLGWTPAARQFQARVALLRNLDPDIADLADAALAAAVADWLEPALIGLSRMADVVAIDLLPLLRARLGWADAARIDRDLPTHIRLGTSGAAVDYAGPVPVVSARAQAFYGLNCTPTLAGGRIQLQVALLSPAGRPIAITSDLAGFWRGAWADARRDMRGRYPRHDWPEHPGRCHKP